jgi:hypothetical protein
MAHAAPVTCTECGVGVLIRSYAAEFNHCNPICSNSSLSVIFLELTFSSGPCVFLIMYECVGVCDVDRGLLPESGALWVCSMFSYIDNDTQCSRRSPSVYTSAQHERARLAGQVLLDAARGVINEAGASEPSGSPRRASPLPSLPSELSIGDRRMHYENLRAMWHGLHSLLRPRVRGDVQGFDGKAKNIFRLAGFNRMDQEIGYDIGVTTHNDIAILAENVLVLFIKVNGVPVRVRLATTGGSASMPQERRL